MNQNEPIPVKDVLADETHPAHNDLKEMLSKLESGELSLCGCVGEMYGEPHCPCKMKRLGLPPSEARLKAEEEARNNPNKLSISDFFKK